MRRGLRKILAYKSLNSNPRGNLGTYNHHPLKFTFNKIKVYKVSLNVRPKKNYF